MSAAERELTVRVDGTRCVGTGACARTAPGDLELGPDGRARVLRPVSDDLPNLTEAAELCPVEAITVHSAATGELLAPRY
ncbi:MULTISPECIES: ferredoxin [Kitasatospora]|uniref:Ferredoxin n=1 Tax=Kitasatospora cystarginea TaxID=58350 RepID=A0ABN3DZJ7_9ACTN